MTAAILAAVSGAGAVVLVVARPAPPRRVTTLLARTAPPAPRRPARHPAAVVGRLARRLLRRPHGDPVADRRLGSVILAGVLAGVLDPLLAAIVGATGALGLRWRRSRTPRSEPDERRLETELPELVDLLALTVAAGLTVPASLTVVARSAPAMLRPDLREATEGIAAGARVEAALGTLGHRWGEPARPLVHALVDHVRYGTPLLPALDRVANDARGRRRRAAEIRARRLPVLLLFPLVLCTLPAFGLLTVAPLVAGTLGSLEESPLEAPASTTP